MVAAQPVKKAFMSNRIIEAVLRVSSKLGSMQAFSTLGGKLAQVDRQAKAFNRSQMLVARGANEMSAALMRYAAPAAIAAMGVTSAKAFATIERRMERIGITADASAKQTAAALDTVRRVANDLGAPVENVIEGLENLVSSGKSLDEALAFLPSVAGTAHAADAAFGDMATTADAIGTSLKITAGEMERAFDILAKGGKAGKFELKDMASELPSLAPAFAALGYEGEAGLKKLTAALQTVRLETGTSSEAATSFMDVLTKMESETMKNNFKRFGIDIRKEMARARAAGQDTLETFIRLSTQAVKGDMSKLPQLFTDKQMLIGMRALINNTEQFAGFMRELGDATGTVRADLARLADDAQTDLDRIGNSWTKLKQTVGSGIVNLGVLDGVDSLTEEMRKGDAIHTALAKSGMSAWDQGMWKLGSNFDPSARDSMAWVGGYRSEDQRRAIDGYGAYAKARSASAAPAAGGIPIPTGRPGSGDDMDARMRRARDVEQYGIYGRRGQSQGPQPSAWDRFLFGDAATSGGFRAGMQIKTGLSDAGPKVESADEFEARITAALSRGGDDAATKLADSGQKFGDAATEKLRTEAASAGTVFGQAAADAFNRGARAPRAAAGVSGDLGIVGTP